MLHGLVLRLSGDQARRAQAIPLRELWERIVPIYEEWRGPNRLVAT